MYISQLSIQGYKNTFIKSTISLNKGLNVLVGENGCGKTTIINALRFLFREPESNYAISTDDFYSSLDGTEKSNSIQVDAIFKDLTENEKIIFLSWCNADFNAQLHLQIFENTSKPGAVKRKYWGGASSASIFEEDSFDKIECIYLPPLRDAEAKLSAGRRSRLALLLKKKYGGNTDELVTNVNEFNSSIVENKDGKYSEIQEVKSSINRKIQEALGKHLSQSVNLQFTESTFNRIIENIRLVFFPGSEESDLTKFRDLATNSLGYNNLLYIATVFAELELIENSDVFTILLIEEPEAHLHPQLQVKFIKYLESLSTKLQNAQVIVSTHSPVLASSVEINKLIHLTGKRDSITATTLSQKKFNDPVAESYINRWLDVTKSTMLFSRGVILVEGIAETLLIPKLAEIVLKKYKQSNPSSHLASSLDEMGVSVININGINFKYFLKLFGNFEDSSGPNIPIYCAGVTDNDPGSTIFPQKGEQYPSKNYIVSEKKEIDKNEFIKLFVSPLKTFEYDLATDNPTVLASTLYSLWPTRKGEVSSKLQKIVERKNKYDDLKELTEDVCLIYKYINDNRIGKGLFASSLVDNISDDFCIPDYIEEAIFWACGEQDHDKR